MTYHYSRKTRIHSNSHSQNRHKYMYSTSSSYEPSHMYSNSYPYKLHTYPRIAHGTNTYREPIHACMATYTHTNRIHTHDASSHQTSQRIHARTPTPMYTPHRFVLGTSLSWEDLDAARNNKLPPSVSSKDVGSALEALHQSGGNVLGVLHSLG